MINGEPMDDPKLVRCAKILGCKPRFVDWNLREMYRKIKLCDEILNEQPLTPPPS